MIEPDAVRASIIQQGGISQAVLGVVHIPVTVHLKPVNMLLLGQTIVASRRRQHHHPLLPLVVPQLHVVIHHAIVADAALIHIYITFIIGDVIPIRCLVLRFYLSHIESGKIRSS